MADKNFKKVVKICCTDTKFQRRLILKVLFPGMLHLIYSRPIYAYGCDAGKAEYVIKHADEYKNNIDKNLMAALAKKKERAKNKAAQNNKH